jgi:transcriptional regulator with XRE-family HTH domain
MDDFGNQVRSALAGRGLSMRGAAAAIHYNVSFLSRVVNGKQRPSQDLVDALNGLLGTELSAPDGPRPHRREKVPANEFVRNAMSHFLEHDNRHGGDHVADAAVQIWKSRQRVMDGRDRQELSTVAELAEISGWILFDANRQEEARAAFMESQLLARLAGDRPLEWFALDLLAMHGVENNRIGQVLALSEEILSRPRIPPRVALLANVRKSRALALAGDRARASDAMARARGALEDSMDERDPEWAWWVDDEEISGHEGEMFLALCDASAAVAYFQRTNELVDQGGMWGRRALSYRTAELAAFVDAGAWRDCEATLTRLAPILPDVTSSRTRRRLMRTVRAIDREAPAWLVSFARDVVLSA